MVNVVGATLPVFYIFKRFVNEKNYIKLCKLGSCMVMQMKAWTIAYIFNHWLPLFFRYVLGGISQQNHHLLIMDGHGSHVTIKTLGQTTKFGLDMVTLPFHISHMLQPFNVTCFKPFKIALNHGKKTFFCNQTKSSWQNGWTMLHNNL